MCNDLIVSFHRPHFKQELGHPFNTLLLIQCDSSYASTDLIACARYRIYDERAHNEKKGMIHIVFIVFVPHYNATSNQDLPLLASTVGYLGDPWISAHIDDLRPNIDASVTPHAAHGLSISELFIGHSNAKQTLRGSQHQIVPLHRRLQDCVQASASKLEDVTWTRATKRIEILVGLIPKDSHAIGKLMGYFCIRIVGIYQYYDILSGLSLLLG